MPPVMSLCVQPALTCRINGHTYKVNTTTLVAFSIHDSKKMPSYYRLVSFQDPKTSVTHAKEGIRALPTTDYLTQQIAQAVEEGPCTNCMQPVSTSRKWSSRPKEILLLCRSLHHDKDANTKGVIDTRHC